MQTFLPYESFERSARVLDRRRLGKQRVEVYQILKCLGKGYTGGWNRHPAVLMWKGHEHDLVEYGLAICSEWIRRGYGDSCYNKIASQKFYFAKSGSPKWLGDADFHASHRSNLLRKDPKWYSQFGWTEPSTLPYVWPVVSVRVIQQTK